MTEKLLSTRAHDYEKLSFYNKNKAKEQEHAARVSKETRNRVDVQYQQLMHV